MPPTRPADEYDGAVTGENADTIHEAAPIAVEVAGTVTVREFPPRNVTTDQVPVAVLPTRLVNAVRTRARVHLAPIGGDVTIGNESVTVGTGYLVPDGATIVLDSTGDVWGIAATVGTTVHVLSEHRDG